MFFKNVAKRKYEKFILKIIFDSTKNFCPSQINFQKENSLSN